MPTQEYLIVNHLSTKDIIRIFKRVVVTRSGCWEWQGNRSKRGYGRLRFRNREELVHRILYAWTVGPVPRRITGQKTPNLDHATCDNPPCCNPIHVKLVSPRENNRRSTKSAAGIKSRKTHCIRGHLLPPLSPIAIRRCRTCAKDRRNRETPEQREHRLQQMKNYQNLRMK